MDRLSYVKYLFFDFGAVGGFTAMWGSMFLALEARHRVDCRMLLGGALTFFLFLSLMPAKLRPFTFIEIQERYLTVLLPFLAIGAGGAVSTVLECLKDRGLRFSALGLLVVAFCYNLLIPNDMLDRYRLLEFVGIRQVLKSAREREITELVLPESYSQYTPDSYYSYGVRLRFLKFDDDASADKVREYLESGRSRAVFIPRMPFRRLKQLVRIGEYDSFLEAGNAGKLIELLGASGFRRENIRVPYTSFRSWLYLVGIETKGQLVGWLYVRVS